MYSKKKRHNTLRYKPNLKGKRYEEGTMILNFEYMMGSPVTETDEAEQILGVIVAHK